MYYDIIIIGSGISGLYAAYHIQKMSPSTSFIILEKYKKNWIGGRTSNDMFYGTQIVTGAGVGRKNKDKLLIQLLNDLDLPYEEFPFTPYYSTQIDKIVDVKRVIQHLHLFSFHTPSTSSTEYNQKTSACKQASVFLQTPILLSKKIRKNVKSIVGISPTMVLLFPVLLL